jgi:ABC-type branched-subunit amino acid transport system permease subunit
VLGLVLVLFPFVAANFGNSWVRIIDFALLYIMLALGLNIVVGFAGLLDLGYIAFYAVGAYLAALFRFTTVCDCSGVVCRKLSGTREFSGDAVWS